MICPSKYFGEQRFRIWCQKVLPTVYDDSLSYYELLCKVLKVLEEVANEVASVEHKLNSADTLFLGVGYNTNVDEDCILAIGDGDEETPDNNTLEVGGNNTTSWIKLGGVKITADQLQQLLNLI